MFRMCVVLLVFSSICTVVVGAPVTVTGFKGHRFDIRCPYESGYESNPKYLCKGECNIGNKVIMVKSGSPAKDQRFSLSDDTTARVFTVTITDLRLDDEGRYWCGVERTVTDVYSEIMLLVKNDNKTTEVSTTSTFTATPSYFSTTQPYPQSSSITITERKDTITERKDAITYQHNSSEGDVLHTDSVIYISVGLVIMLVIFLMALTLLCMKRSRKSPRVTQSGLSQQVSVVLLPLNENTAEDFNDHKYEEINKWQHKNKDITTVYTTADRLDDPTIYSTADKPDDSMIYSTADKPDDPMIYSTADKPDDPLIYSTADKPDDPMIYSTADKPDDPLIYSTADKPDDPMIYSTADKPDDPLIYSTADKPDDPLIYSTADKPDDPMIYSTADKPDDPLIYSTADKPDDPMTYSTADEPDDPLIYSTADEPDVSAIYSTVD